MNGMRQAVQLWQHVVPPRFLASRRCQHGRDARVTGNVICLSATKEGAARYLSSRRRARGTILIVVLLVLIALTSMVLVLCRAARVEAMASANHVADARAQAVARGAEQYVLAMIAQQRESVLDLDETYFEAVAIGEGGYFWVIRPDHGDPQLPLFGLVDEASKLNLNSATPEMLLAVGAPQELADSVADWRDPDSEPTAGGAEDEHYMSLANPYHCKNGPFETVEEILLVRGATPELIYGTSGSIAGRATDQSGGIASGFASAPLGDQLAAYGLFDYLTVYSIEPPESEGSGRRGERQRAQARIGRINVLTASREVLLCLPDLNESDVNTLISNRASAGTITGTTSGTGSGTGSGSTSGNGEQPNSLDWVTKALGDKAARVMPLITDKSYQYSADIVAASADGRAYRRVRIVINALDSAAPPKIVYRRDLTTDGWPLDPAILEELRLGNTPAAGLGIFGRAF